jgi:hypothetical protein
MRKWDPAQCTASAHRSRWQVSHMCGTPQVSRVQSGAAAAVSHGLLQILLASLEVGGVVMAKLVAHQGHSHNQGSV